MIYAITSLKIKIIFYHHFTIRLELEMSLFFLSYVNECYRLSVSSGRWKGFEVCFYICWQSFREFGRLVWSRWDGQRLFRFDLIFWENCSASKTNLLSECMTMYHIIGMNNWVLCGRENKVHFLSKKRKKDVQKVFQWVESEFQKCIRVVDWINDRVVMEFDHFCPQNPRASLFLPNGAKLTRAATNRSSNIHIKPIPLKEV
jgi:hypothetical protein